MDGVNVRPECRVHVTVKPAIKRPAMVMRLTDGDLLIKLMADSVDGLRDAVVQGIQQFHGFRYQYQRVVVTYSPESARLQNTVQSWMGHLLPLLQHTEHWRAEPPGPTVRFDMSGPTTPTTRPVFPHTRTEPVPTYASAYAPAYIPYTEPIRTEPIRTEPKQPTSAKVQEIYKHMRQYGAYPSFEKIHLLPGARDKVRRYIRDQFDLRQLSTAELDVLVDELDRFVSQRRP
jgi:hypothetical protein